MIIFLISVDVVFTVSSLPCSITGYVIFSNNGSLVTSGGIKYVIKETGLTNSSSISGGSFTLDCNITSLQNKNSIGLVANTSDEKIGYSGSIVGPAGFASQTQVCTTKQWHFNGLAIDPASGLALNGNILVGIDDISVANSTKFTNGAWDIYYSPCLISGNIYTFRFSVNVGNNTDYAFMRLVAK